MKPRFNRDNYLELKSVFEKNKLDDVAYELSEFDHNPIELAYELAYTRYYLAKAEEQLEVVRWLEEVLKFKNETDMTQPAKGELEKTERVAWEGIDMIIFGR